jgi:cyclopropane fatty-acyl-phospholipid synthase-like methyltransferase
MDLDSLLRKPEFPLSARYDRDWVLDNQMGPNALWLVEWLGEVLALAPGMRVLDLGCGRALTSVFLARERGARVWAADLWISPDHNWRRVGEAGVADLVCPMRVEAHALPFAQGFFDAIVSVDSYQYFGTDDLYLSYLCGFLRPGGLLGIVVPGLVREFGDQVPEHLTRPQANGKSFWEDACACFHSADWWHRLWSRSSLVEDVHTNSLPDGWRHWRDFEQALELAGKQVFPSDAETLERDKGRTIAFVRAVARRTTQPAESLYDPAAGLKAGVDS